jgi:hypothetical protein
MSKTQEKQEVQNPVGQSSGFEDYEQLDPEESETIRKGMERIENDAKEGRKGAVSLRYVRLCDSFSSELAAYREVGIETVLRGDSTSFKLIEALHKIGKRAVIGALRAWFTPLDFVRSHPGGDKGNLVYIPGEYTLALLSAFFPGSWSFDTLNREILEGEAVCEGKLIINWPDGTMQFMTSDGRSAIRYNEKTQKPLSIGDNFKGARTDAIKKAAAQLLGIGWDVYGGHRTISTSPRGKREVQQPETLNEAGKAIAKYMKTNPLPKGVDAQTTFKMHFTTWGVSPDEAREIIAKHSGEKPQAIVFAKSSYETLNRYNAILTYYCQTKKKAQAPEQPEESRPETPAEPMLDFGTYKKLADGLASASLKFMIDKRSASVVVEETITAAYKDLKDYAKALQAGFDFCREIDGWFMSVQLEEELIKWGVK